MRTRDCPPLFNSLTGRKRWSPTLRRRSLVVIYIRADTNFDDQIVNSIDMVATFAVHLHVPSLKGRGNEQHSSEMAMDLVGNRARRASECPFGPASSKMRPAQVCKGQV